MRGEGRGEVGRGGVRGGVRGEGRGEGGGRGEGREGKDRIVQKFLTTLHFMFFCIFRQQQA